MIIRGIFTNTKLSPERMNSETTVPYIVANECPGLKRGDLVQLVGYDSKFQVVWTYASSREQESYETVTISATFRVIVNPFNFDSSNGFNPLAFMSGNRFDVKNLLMMSAFNGGGLFNNAGKGFNPIMLMALADKSSSDFMTITLMSQLMGGGNMFGNMFGAANKPAAETPEPSELDKINAKVDTLIDNVNALVSALASNIKSQAKEEA